MDFALLGYMNRAFSMILLCWAIVLATLGMACSSDSQPPMAPSQTTDVSGTWAGNVIDAGTTARMTWTLSETGTAVTGPVLLGLSSGIVLMNGFLTGTVSGTTLTYSISVGPGGIPLQPSCAGQIGGTMAVTIGAVSTLVGTPAVTSSTCTPPLPGG